MTPKEGLPSFWVTHLAKVLIGENPCLLQPWIASRFNWPKTVSAGMSAWKEAHTTALRALAEQYRKQGYKVDLERFYRVTGQTAVLSGKADLIATKANERPLVIDVKTGVARDSDVAQVIISMLMLPLAWNVSMTFSGLIVYPDREGVDVTARQAAELKPKVFALLRELGTMPKPVPSPGKDACRYCDVPDSECGVRWKDEDVEAATMEF